MVSGVICPTVYMICWYDIMLAIHIPCVHFCCPLQLNSYATVNRDMVWGRREALQADVAEEGTNNIQEAFVEMLSSDETEGSTDLVQEDDEVFSSDYHHQSAEDPLKDGLENKTGLSAVALQRDDLKQFYKTDKTCFDGEEVHACEESAVNEIGDVHSLNEPLGEVEQNVPDMMKVIKVIESERRADPTLQEDTLSMSI